MSPASASTRPPRRRVLSLLALVWAGESIYLLPYALRRDYAGVLIDALGLSGEAELGAYYSFFGGLTLIAYLLGGRLADRLSPRVLIPISLVLTAAGGGLLAAFPQRSAGLYGLFVLWAFSTILTFWAALIKATRALGGDEAQGRAFGFLDGGRGLVAAALASIGLQLFAAAGEGATGLRAVIALYAGACLLGAVAAAVALRGAEPVTEDRARGGWADLKAVLRRKDIWLLGGVIFFAYAAYYGTFYFAGYAGAQGADEASAAGVSVAALWLRPLVPLLAGFAADRSSAGRVTVAAFALLGVGFTSLSALPPAEGLTLLAVQAALVAGAAFALRGVYYALLAEGGVPERLTGTAVGVVAVIGYTPDVLTPYLFGRLLDARPGVGGYRSLFGILALGSMLGGILAWLHRRHAARPSASNETAPNETASNETAPNETA